MEPNKILILGAGVYAEEVADLVFDCEGFQLVGFIDEFNPPGAGINKMNLPVMTLDEAAELSESHVPGEWSGRQQKRSLYPAGD